MAGAADVARRGGGRRRAPAALALALLALSAAPAVAAPDPVATRGLGALPLAPATASRAPRVGVVIGNGAYAHAAPLPNAVADAQAFAAFLRDHGFAVHEGYDLDKRGVERLLRRVLQETDAGAEVALFYAGHGVQVGRRNYLLPVDADLRDPVDLPFETISLDRVTTVIGARSKLQLMMLDSCRENPFAGARLMAELDARLYEAEQGFEPAPAPLNTLLSYSTSPGRLAVDGPPGEGSPYARALLAALEADPGREIGAVLGEVRRAVVAATEGRQVPWESSTLVEPFVFAAAPESLVLAAAGAADPVLRGPDAPAPPAAAAPQAPVLDAPVAPAPLTLAEAAPAPAAPAGGAAPALAPVAPDPEPGAGPAVDAAPPPPDPAAALAALDGRRVTLALPLDRSVALGTAVAAALGPLPEGATLALAAAPAHGLARLGDAALAESAPERPAALAALAYDPAIRPVTPGPDPAAHAVTDAFALVLRAGEATARVEVALELAMDPCDWAAGAQYDPQGLGIDRLPNELEPEAALAACEAAAARAPEAGRFQFQRGRALAALRRNDEARAAYEQAIGLGHVRALGALGALIHNEAAQGLAANAPAPPEALALMERGSAAGDPYAAHLLGQQLLRHGSDEAARARGFELLSEAVEVGHTYAMNELGYFFVSAEGQLANPDRGLRYLEESAARGDVYGWNNLGLVRLRGLGGVPVDEAAAYDWFLKAAEGGHPYAPGNLGRMLTRGVAGAPPDPDAALRWYDAGLARGDAWGGANGAWLIAERGAGGLGAADAAERAAKAATLRDAEAAEAARAVLDRLPAAAQVAAVQRLLAALGEPIAVDGRAGPQTRGALDARRAALDLGPAPRDPAGMALAAAEAWWRASPLRLDLF